MPFVMNFPSKHLSRNEAHVMSRSFRILTKILDTGAEYPTRCVREVTFPQTDRSV